MESVEERRARVERLETARAGRRGEDRALTVENVPALMLQRTTAGVPISPRGALAIADVFACVKVLAETAATLPLQVFRRTPGRRERIEGGVAELLWRPAPAVTQASFVAQMVTHLCLWGECFVGMYRDQDGAVFQLGVLAPDRITVENRGGLPTYGYADENGRYGVYSMRDILHIKSMSLDGLRGMSPIRQCKEALGYAGALAKHGSEFIAEGARPSGILYVQPGPHADEQIDNLKTAWEERHQVAGRVGLLTGEAKFEAVSMPLADAQFLEQMDFSTAQIARMFGLPPSVVNAKTNSPMTYANVTDELRRFVTMGLKGSTLVPIEQGLSGCVDLFPPEQRTYCLFELDGLLRGAPEQRAEVYTKALDPVTGWMRRDEVRALEELPPERQEVPTHV